jgi:hypothetical protein
MSRKPERRVVPPVTRITKFSIAASEVFHSARSARASRFGDCSPPVKLRCGVRSRRAIKTSPR